MLTLTFLGVFSCLSPCHGQQPASTAVITDLAPLPVSTRFGSPNQFKLAGNGDVYFTSGANSALFRWSPGAAAPVRLLQTNDPIEALGLPQELLEELPPGGLLDSVGVLLQTNASGQAAFVATVALTGEGDPGAIFVYDGSSYRFIDVGVDTYSQLFLNAGGKIAVLGNGSPLNVGRTKIYLESNSGEEYNIAEQFQPAPDSVGGTYSTLSLIGFNDSGQVAFLAGIVGGRANLAVFLSDGGPPQLVVKSGDSASGSGTFTLRTGLANYFLNNAGQVAFAADVTGGAAGIWIGDASAPPAKLMRVNESAGTDLGGTYAATWNLRGLNDAGQALFSANLTGGKTAHALLLKSPSDPAPQVIFSKGQPAGTTGDFDTTQQASVDPAGNIAFLATLTGGNSAAAWFLGSPTSTPVKIAAQGETTPAGGSFGLLGKNTPAQINNAGQVAFLADIPDGDAVGLFTWTIGGEPLPVVSTNDSLPEGANTLMRALSVSASDAEVLVRALQAGGQATYYASEFKSGGNFRKIVADFDHVPDAGTVINPNNFSVNGKGEAVFTSPLLGSEIYPQPGIIASTPSAGLFRAVLVGDPLPGGGKAASFGPPQLNNQSQIAFLATTDLPNTSGIFLASAEPPHLQQVAHSGDAWPGTGNFTIASFNNSLSLNDKGQVAFLGVTSAPAHQGLFIGSGSAAPAKVVEATDPAPTGTFTDFPIPFELNANGQLAFVANYRSASANGSGVFLGTATSAPSVIAKTGSSAPGVDGLTFSAFLANSIDLNNSGQVAFWAGLCCSNDVFSGWFLGSAEANPVPRLLPNQALPAGGRASVVSPGSRIAALADSGELAIYLPDIDDTDLRPQIVVAGADGALRKVAANGEQADTTGSQYGKLYPTLIATPSGRFLFGGMLLNGPAKSGVFISNP